LSNTAAGALNPSYCTSAWATAFTSSMNWWINGNTSSSSPMYNVSSPAVGFTAYGDWNL